jgi:hypothetical protein
MCSNAGWTTRTWAQTNMPAQLTAAIDELAAAVGADADADSADIAERLVHAWAVIAAAYPELATRTARYTRSAPGDTASPPVRQFGAPDATAQSDGRPAPDAPRSVLECP